VPNQTKPDFARYSPHPPDTAQTYIPVFRVARRGAHDQLRAVSISYQSLKATLVNVDLSNFFQETTPTRSRLWRAKVGDRDHSRPAPATLVLLTVSHRFSGYHRCTVKWVFQVRCTPVCMWMKFLGSSPASSLRRKLKPLPLRWRAVAKALNTQCWIHYGRSSANCSRCSSLYRGSFGTKAN